MIVEIVVVLDSKENCEIVNLKISQVTQYLIILIHNDQYDYK